MMLSVRWTTVWLSPNSGFDVVAKITFLFLAFMAILAIFGKLRFPGQDQLAAAKCQQCGRYRIGKGPCRCGKG